jgi:hypothetical protein
MEALEGDKPKGPEDDSAKIGTLLVTGSIMGLLMWLTPAAWPYDLSAGQGQELETNARYNATGDRLFRTDVVARALSQARPGLPMEGALLAPLAQLFNDQTRCPNPKPTKPAELTLLVSRARALLAFRAVASGPTPAPPEHTASIEQLVAALEPELHWPDLEALAAAGQFCTPAYPIDVLHWHNLESANH